VSPATAKLLLDLARQTIVARVRGQSLPALPDLPEGPVEFGGAFVTIRVNGRLRGCIGRFRPDRSLAETVQAMAVASLEDPRFRHAPVRVEELKRLHIEISVLSPLVRTRDPLSLEPGVHGVYIRRGSYSGCFLPQVATEQKWDLETFLSRCCEDKAGLPPDAWKDPETEVFAFTCEVVEEDCGSSPET